MNRIDKQLKENSQPMTAKRKGFSAVGKWEFGSYRMISSESGWTKSKSSSPIFGDHTTVNASVKKSYVLVNEADTCIANIRVLENIETNDGSWFFHDLLKWSEPVVEKGEGIFESIFSLSTDTIPWRLAVIYPLEVELEDGSIRSDHRTSFRGLLTDDQTVIEIREVYVNEDGKSPVLTPVKGYEFWLNSESVAAVQVMPVNRFYVWIRSDLHDTFKFLLANAAAAMLVKSF